MKSIVMIFMIFVQFGYANNNYYYKNNQKVYLKQVTPITEVTSDIVYYKNDKNIVLGVSDKLIVKFKNELALQNYLYDYNLAVVKKIANKLYLIKTQDKNETIDISQKLSEQDDIEYAHPDFIKKIKRR